MTLGTSALSLPHAFNLTQEAWINAKTSTLSTDQNLYRPNFSSL